MSPRSRSSSRLSFLFPLLEKDSNNSISGDKNSSSLFPESPEEDPGCERLLLRGEQGVDVVVLVAFFFFEKKEGERRLHVVSPSL